MWCFPCQVSITYLLVSLCESGGLLIFFAAGICVKKIVKHMEEELKKILGDKGQEPVAPLEPKEPVTPAANDEDPEVKAKAQQLANLNKAIADETERLRAVRKARQDEAAGGTPKADEDLPQIDLNDPSAKAWDKRIRDSSAPVQEELEKAKEERRLYALRQFLEGKPSLSKNPEKIRAMMATYDRIKTSTELTGEGITMDLERAYAAEHSSELMNAVRNGRVDAAREDAIFSDIAVSRGSTGYSESQPTAPRKYSADEIAQLQKWGMTPTEHAAMVKEVNEKEASQ